MAGSKGRVTQRDFARRLNEAIERRRATNPELAAAIGKHKDTISRYRRETDPHGPPSDGIRRRLEKALRAPEGYLDGEVALDAVRVPEAVATGTAGVLTGHLASAYWAGYRAGMLRAAGVLQELALSNGGRMDPRAFTPPEPGEDPAADALLADPPPRAPGTRRRRSG